MVAGGAEIATPEFDVMTIGPVRRPVASRPGASLVSGSDGATNVGGEGAGGPADVQHFRFAAQDHRDDLRIAEEPSGLGGADHRAGVETGVRDQPGECVPLHGDGDVGPFAALDRAQPGVQVAAQCFDQSVGPAVRRGPHILHGVAGVIAGSVRPRCGQGVDGFLDDFDAVVVQLALDRRETGSRAAITEVQFHLRGGGGVVDVPVGVDPVQDPLRGVPR